jgi:acyl carrier protein
VTIEVEIVEEQVRAFFAAKFPYGGEQPAADASLIDSGYIDSMWVLELLEFVEGTYGLSVPEADIRPENFDSIAGIAQYVSQRLAPA